MGWFEAPMTMVRRGPNWASIGLAQEAEVGVKHSSTSFRAARPSVDEDDHFSPRALLHVVQTDSGGKWDGAGLDAGRGHVGSSR